VALAKHIPKHRLLTESEWRNFGVQQSRLVGWLEAEEEREREQKNEK
jgi:hypothetical protein